MEERMRNALPKNRTALGRGLGSLIPQGKGEKREHSFEDELGKRGLAQLLVNELAPCADQPRQHFDEKSLQELIEEMAQSGSKKLGDMSGLGQDIDEVIKDLKQGRYTRKTQDRQQRILSRMLDSQKSMTQRGEKEERLAETASEILNLTGPSGLPEDLGQRHSLTSEALNQAIQAGYTQEYVTMIRRYFNALSQSSLLESSPSDIPKSPTTEDTKND